MGTSETFRYDLAVVAVYVYSRAALLRITDMPRRFALDVPSLDLTELETQLDSVEGLPLASAKAFLAANTFVSQTIAEMRRSGAVEWTATPERSEQWWANARAAAQQKQAARR
jgi:hypothetical protein